MVPFESLRIRFSDQYEAYARWWQPVRPRGAVLYLHGIQSHGLWFEASARRLAEAGFAVLLPDRRGSGRNDADRGHLPSAKRLLADLADCLNEIHVRTGFTRAHLVGVSWGGTFDVYLDPVSLLLMNSIHLHITALSCVHRFWQQSEYLTACLAVSINKCQLSIERIGMRSHIEYSSGPGTVANRHE